MTFRRLFLAVALCLLGAPAGADPYASQPSNLKPIAPKAAILFNEGVQALNDSHDVVAASEKFKQALEISPDFADAHTNYGTALVLQGKYQEALPELETSIKLKPNSTPAWATLGSCYQSLGHSQKAIDAYKKFLQLEPNGPQSARTKSVVATLENELKRAGGESSASTSADDYLGDATLNGVARWPAGRLPVTIFIKPGTDIPGYRNAFESILRQAFSDWEESSNGKIKLAYVTDPDKAEINCSWTNDPAKMMTSAEGGHAMVIPDSQGILRVNMTLLTVPPSGIFKMTDNYARRIALHEVGHSLGILGHSKDPADIMFASIPPADVEANLTKRDKGTLVALYSASGDRVAKPIDMKQMLMSGDPSSNVMKTIKLNAEAAEAMNKKDFITAISKLEEARKIDPNNDLINQNLGAAYGNMGTMMCMVRNFSQADHYFKLALPLLEHGPNKANYTAMLKNYAVLLRMQGRATEAAAAEAKLQAAPH